MAMSEAAHCTGLRYSPIKPGSIENNSNHTITSKDLFQTDKEVESHFSKIPPKYVYVFIFYVMDTL